MHTRIHTHTFTNIRTFMHFYAHCMYSSIHTYTYNTRKHAYMHKYKRMRIHTHRQKIPAPLCFLQNDVPIHTHINYITQIFMKIIRFKLQYDHFLVHFLFSFCTNKSNAKVYTLIIHGKKMHCSQSPKFQI